MSGPSSQSIEPAQVLEQLLLVLFFGALDVRVFYAQNESPAAVPRKKPIEERCARVAHVDVTRGAGRKTNSNLGHNLIFTHLLTIAHLSRFRGAGGTDVGAVKKHQAASAYLFLVEWAVSWFARRKKSYRWRSELSDNKQLMLQLVVTTGRTMGKVSAPVEKPDTFAPQLPLSDGYCGDADRLVS